MHLSNYDEKKWLMKKMEVLSLKKFSKEEKMKILKELTNVETFNHFLNEKLKTERILRKKRRNRIKLLPALFKK